MERKWYKIVNGVWHEAPYSVETENGWITGYNTEANEQVLRADGYLPENEIDINTKIVPEKITSRQLRSSLIMSGIKLAVIDTIISTLPESQQSLAKVDWEYSTNFYRDNTMINQIAGALKLTSEKVDEIFIQGATLIND